MSREAAAGSTVPLYYFDIYDNGRLIRDNHGVDLDNLYDAREQALALLPDIARDASPDGDHHDYACVVKCSAMRVRYRTSLTIHSEWIEAPTYPRPD